MKKIFLAIAILAFCSTTQAQDQQYKHDYIEINARAQREVTPDEIFLKIVLDQNDTKGKYTIDQLESMLYKALKAAGVDAEKELLVSDMVTDMQSFLLKKNAGRTTKEYVLKVDNEHLMPVFRELDKQNITNVNIQSTRYSKSKELYDELLGEAVTIAKRRAQIMATAGGVKLMQMIFIQSYDSSPSYDTAPMASDMVMSMSAKRMSYEAAPSFGFNKIRIDASVTVRFKI